MLRQVNSTTILQDLVRRARGGIVVYPLVWFVTALWADLPSTTPLFFYINTFIFCILLVSRTVVDLAAGRYGGGNPGRLIDALVWLVLASCLHWGLLSSWVIYIGDYPELHYPYIVILAAFCTGGTTTLSISRPLRILYPFLMFGPAVVLAVVIGGPEDRVLALLAVLTIVYILDASRISSRDYWAAVHQHRLAEKRAVKLKELSVTDVLTQIGNRAFFEQEYALAWERCRQRRTPIALLILDLDHFKSINDTYGHGCGDRCLEMVGLALKNDLTRATDIIARYGGEEFVIVLAGSGLEEAERVAERIVKGVAAFPFSHEGATVSLSCSIGVAAAAAETGRVRADELILAADRALYRAKEQGRNRWCSEA